MSMSDFSATARRDYTDRLVFVIAMPRSRTAWLVQFFSKYMVAWHDPLKKCESIGELAGKIDRALFNNQARASKLLIADTAACFFIPKLRERFPGAKFIVIERDYADVCLSLKTKGVFSLSIMSATVAAFRSWEVYLPRHRTAVVAFKNINIALEDLAAFVGIVGEGWDAEAWRDYKREMVQTYIDIPFARQYADTDWAKVRKLLHGKFDFRNDTRLNGG